MSKNIPYKNIEGAQNVPIVVASTKELDDQATVIVTEKTNNYAPFNEAEFEKVMQQRLQEADFEEVMQQRLQEAGVPTL